MKRLIPLLAVSLMPAFAMAETHEDMSFDGMMAFNRVDANRNGMVSKQEFLAMMGRVWDMKARQMGVKGGEMRESDLREVLMYLRAGS